MEKAFSKARPKLPAGVKITKDGDGWRVRLGSKFSGGDPIRKRFSSKGEADEWARQQVASRDQIRGIHLTPGQLADARTALDDLEGQTSLTKAVAFYLKHHRRPDQTQPIKDAVKAFLAAKEAKKLKPRSISAYKDTLTPFAEDHDGLTAAQVTQDDVVDWLDEDAWAPSTTLHHQVNLSVFFNWALAKKWLGVVPTEGLDKPTLDDRPPAILTVDQLAAILTSATQHPELAPLIPTIAIGAFAGLRTSELSQLTWEEIDLEERNIEVTAAKSKTRQRRIVTITDNLLTWLTPYVSKGRAWPPNRRKRFPELLEAAGIKEWPKNALRHSFASYHLAFHQDAGKTAHQLGHRDSQMLYDHYRELVKPSAAQKYWKVLPPEDKKVVQLSKAA